MTTLDSSTIPAMTRTAARFRPRLVGRSTCGGKKIVTRAACQMADLLERQSVLLADLGMRRVARDACREVRQLRLLAALEG